MRQWQTCFDCGQNFHGPVQFALSWACWKLYLGRPEANDTRCNALEVLGRALAVSSRSEEALPVLEASLALNRRYWSHDKRAILIAETNLASCLGDLDRHNEALVLKREIYAKEVAS